MELFPPIEPYKTYGLKVSDIHELYVEEVGNPEGEPVIFLHGGPGGGCSEKYRQFFDPKKYRVILFDQRGAGRSTPHAELKENTTWDLIKDIELIREKSDVKKWTVFGGSWGSTLALCYAINHPAVVERLVLRGIFLCRPQEIHWFYQEGASRIFPDVWEKYLEPIPEEERDNLVSAYYKRLTSDDPQVRLQAAKAWSLWEGNTSFLIPHDKIEDDFGSDEFATAFARIECHYFINNIFMESKNYILENCEKIKDIPCDIVQGRYDVVCPTDSAWQLHKALPKSNLHIIKDSGHNAFEPGIKDCLLSLL